MNYLSVQSLRAALVTVRGGRNDQELMRSSRTMLLLHSGAGVNTSVDGLVSTFAGAACSAVARDQGTPVKAHSVSNSQDCVYRQSAVGTTILEQLRLRSEAFFISNSVSI